MFGLSRESRRRPPWGVALALLLLATSCDHGWPGIETDRRTEAGVRPVRLLDFELPLHVAQERTRAAGHPLVLFATGDGGWRDVDREVFETFVRLGFPTAGFSAKDYLDHLDARPEDATRAHVARDYARLISEARAAMGIAEATPVLLSGFSRGASLSVIAAGAPELRPYLQGVLAIGLGDVEEHVHSRRGMGPTAIDSEVVRPYEHLGSLDGLKLSVLQSTHDRFLDARRARELFGPDTARRELHAIEGGSHTFRGAREPLKLEIARSLQWIEASPTGSGR